MSQRSSGRGRAQSWTPSGESREWWAALYVALLWAYGLLDQMGALADPTKDEEGLALAVSRERARAARKSSVVTSDSGAPTDTGAMECFVFITLPGGGTPWRAVKASRNKIAQGLPGHSPIKVFGSRPTKWERQPLDV